MAITFSCTSKTNKDKYKDLPKELADLSIKIDENPTNAELYSKRSEYYIQNKQLENAFADALKALKLDSNNRWITRSGKYRCKLRDCFISTKI